MSVGEGGEEVHGILGVGVVGSVPSSSGEGVFSAACEIEISLSFSCSGEGEEFTVRGLIYLTLSPE